MESLYTNSFICLYLQVFYSSFFHLGLKASVQQCSVILQFIGVYIRKCETIRASDSWLATFKGSCCFLEKKTLPSLCSTGWSQEWIRVWFLNLTEINWRPYGRLTFKSNKLPDHFSFVTLDVISLKCPKTDV